MLEHIISTNKIKKTLPFTSEKVESRGDIVNANINVYECTNN